MNLNLNTWQRVQLEKLVGDVKGAASTVRKAVKLLDILEMSDEEKTKVGFRQQGGMLLWDDLEHTWEVEIKDGNLEVFLRELVKGKTDWPVNRYAIDIFDQFGLEDEK